MSSDRYPHSSSMATAHINESTSDLRVMSSQSPLDGAALDGASADHLSSLGTPEAEALIALPEEGALNGGIGEIEGKTAERDSADKARTPHRASGHVSPTALQDMFLNGLRRENIDAVIYFCDGSQERGTVRAFDTFTILIENRNSGKQQLLYKHSIARIFPTRSPAQMSLPPRSGKKPEQK